MDVDEFTALVEQVVEEIPQEFFRGLNGGVLVLEGAKGHPHGPPGTLILAEYVVRPWLGRHIALYHGSFARASRGVDEMSLKEKIRDTLMHELVHHLEHQAGVNQLGKEDVRRIREMWEHQRRRSP